LAVLPLPELTAVLACHADRVLTLLGKTGIVDDPRFDRSLTLNRRRTISPTLANTFSSDQGDWPTKCMQRLVLRCRPIWRRYRRHRLDALTLARHYQAQAIISQWAGPVHMPDHTHNPST